MTVDTYIDVTSVNELTAYSYNNNSLVLGGNLTLSRTIKVLTKISREKNFAYLSDMAEHINLIANVHVRNVSLRFFVYFNVVSVTILLYKISDRDSRRELDDKI